MVLAQLQAADRSEKGVNMNMELEAIYKEFKRIGALKYSNAEYRRYNELSKRVFPMLKAEYQRSGDKVKSIEDLLISLIEEATDPLGFWGSKKIADRNHYVYIADKEGRLFEELRNWYERKIGYDKSGKACIA